MQPLMCLTVLDRQHQAGELEPQMGVQEIMTGVFNLKGNLSGIIEENYEIILEVSVPTELAF